MVGLLTAWGHTVGGLVDLESRVQDVSRDRSSAAALESVFSRGKKDFYVLG